MLEEKGTTLIKDSYSLSLSMMNEATFIDSLCAYSKQSINDETIELLQPYLNHPSFTMEQAKKASPVSVALLQWVKSITQYHAITVSVRSQIRELDAKMTKYQQVCMCVCVFFSSVGFVFFEV
jgi:dynein heavy chain